MLNKNKYALTMAQVPIVYAGDDAADSTDDILSTVPTENGIYASSNVSKTGRLKPHPLDRTSFISISSRRTVVYSSLKLNIKPA